MLKKTGRCHFDPSARRNDAGFDVGGDKNDGKRELVEGAKIKIFAKKEEKNG